jgi:copper chaperone CopZ
MKKIFFLFVSAVLSAGVNAQFTKANLKASGLTCSMCSKAVKVALEKVDFVQEVKVDIKSQDYILAFKDGAKVEFDALSKAVEDAGFSVASLKASGNFSDVKATKDTHIQLGGLNIHFLNGNGEQLNGGKTITVVDKSFLSPKEFKKYSGTSRHPCVVSGKAGDCCTKEGISAEARVYHVII